MSKLIDILKAERRHLSRLLDEPWESLYIDYEKPTVTRLWMPRASHRLYLHRIDPCDAGEPFVHAHAGPVAIYIEDGMQEMLSGYSATDAPPETLSTSILTSGCYYEMADPNLWHSVRPIGTPSYSIMVGGPLWQRQGPKSTKPLRQLHRSERDGLHDFFRSCYP